jgi:hypothetical protein
MSQLVVIAVSASLIWIVYRWFRREMERSEAEFQKAKRKLARCQNKGAAHAVSLDLDHATGRYVQSGE